MLFVVYVTEARFSDRSLYLPAFALPTFCSFPLFTAKTAAQILMPPLESSSKTENSHQSQASTNYKEAFSLFDKRGNGRMALESLGDLLRACGQNPTLAEIAELEKGVGGDCRSFSTFPFTAFDEDVDLWWKRSR